MAFGDFGTSLFGFGFFFKSSSGVVFLWGKECAWHCGYSALLMLSLLLVPQQVKQPRRLLWPQQLQELHLCLWPLWFMLIDSKCSFLPDLLVCISGS